MPGVDAGQLTLSYLVPGIRVNFKKPGLLGVLGEFQLSFDGEVCLYLGVPRSMLRSIVVLGDLLTSNVTLNGSESLAISGWR